MDIFNNLSTSTSQLFTLFGENKIVSSIASLLLVLYTALAAPKLPRFIANLFKNPFFKLVFIFLISYAATKDTTVALISSIALLITIQTLTSYDDADKIVNMIANKLEPIPMTPERKQFIKDCADDASDCYKRAHAERNIKKAKKLIKNAKLQEAKINNIIAAKKLKEEGIIALNKGDAKLANIKFRNADINEIIVASLVRAEYLKVLARNAKNNGDINESMEHLKEAFAQTAKVDAITKIENNPTKPNEKSKTIIKLVDKAEELKKASVIVATQGQPIKANELKKQAAIKINKVVAIVKSGTLKKQPAIKINKVVAIVKSDTLKKQAAIVKVDTLKNPDTMIVGNDTGLFADININTPLLVPHSKDVLEAQNLCSAPRKLQTECLVKKKQTKMCDMTGIKEIGGHPESEFNMEFASL